MLWGLCCVGSGDAVGRRVPTVGWSPQTGVEVVCGCCVLWWTAAGVEVVCGCGVVWWTAAGVVWLWLWVCGCVGVGLRLCVGVVWCGGRLLWLCGCGCGCVGVGGRVCVGVVWCVDGEWGKVGKCVMITARDLGVSVRAAVDDYNFEEYQKRTDEKRSSGRETPLLRACVCGGFTWLTTLLDHGSDDVNVVSASGEKYATTLRPQFQVAAIQTKFP